MSNNSSEKYDKFKRINSLLDFIRKNYNKNHSVQYYADLCNLDKYYFIKLFREYTTDTPLLYRTKLRIEKAKELLIKTNMTNSKIAETIGYSSSYYFSRIFKVHTGMSPDIFRKNNQ